MVMRLPEDSKGADCPTISRTTPTSIGTATAKWSIQQADQGYGVCAPVLVYRSMTCSAARWSATSRTFCTTSTGYGRQYSSYLRTGGSTG